MNLALIENELFYKDVLTLIFSNETNLQYFKKYYAENLLFQKMLRDYLKMQPRTENINIKF